MSAPAVELRPADADALEYVEDRLAANGLPTEDVREKRDCFYVAVDGEWRVGVGGLETVGNQGLLRSVVVEESARGKGYGAAITRAIEDETRATGVDALYLLTTTAAEFFAEQGYEAIDRTDAPPAIQETSQFTDLCPSSATCMTKSL